MKQRPTTLTRKKRRKTSRALRKKILDRTAAARRERDRFIAGVDMGELDDFPICSVPGKSATAIVVELAERPPIPPPVEIDPAELQRVIREAARRTARVERRPAQPLPL